MFSKEYMREIRQGYGQQMALLDAEINRLEEEAASAAGREALPQPVQQPVPPDGIAALRLPMLRAKKQEILDVIGGCEPDEAEAMTFLYSAMPISDVLDYPAQLFLAYARHGVFLRKEGPFAGKVPEKLFANYVLHHRVNNEDIVDLRRFFYEKVRGLAVPGDMAKTVIEANYWCAQEGTYRSTDGRTQNARTMYRTATGRCGEESTFAVTVLRSLGIPARQVYAPLWAHCDDNHAWVEAWCDGKWVFFGACEPEERLNYGWFIGPSSRAMLLHSRWFGPDEPADRVLGRKGMSRVLNHMERYARTTWLTVRAEDENGRPVPDAKVEFQVVNSGELRPIAFLRTAGADSPECGTARLLTGYGDLYVTASDTAEGTVRYGETMVSMIGLKPGQTMDAAVVLHRGPQCTDGFRKLDFYAPKVGNLNDDTLTDAQKSTGLARNHEAAERRAKKKAAFYDEAKAEAVLSRFDEPDRDGLREILRKSLGNLDEILAFLGWDSDCLAAQEKHNAGADPAGRENHDAGADLLARGKHDAETDPAGREVLHGPSARFGEKAPAPGCWKLEVLRALREKDLWDIRADILKECCESAAPYAGRFPDDVFYRFLVNPRVANEMVRLGRHFLAEHMNAARKEAVAADPAILPMLVNQWIHPLPDREYEDLVTSPVACLRGGIGSELSMKVFCVTLYRTLGIPARLRMADHKVEYYRDGAFHPAQQLGVSASGAGTAHLTLSGSGTLHLTEWARYSLDHFEDDHFVRVGMWDHFEELQNNEVHLDLEPGIYRALTTNRRADGSQLVQFMTFALEAGESRSLELALREISPTTMLTEYTVRDFGFKTPDGGNVRLKDLSKDQSDGRDLSGGGKALLVWLEVTREPTEHILNELYEQSADFAALPTPLYVVVKTPEDLDDPTLKQTLAAVPNLHPLLHDFGEEYRVLAEEIGLAADRLPLAMVLEGGARSIYGEAGYNVGLADMLYRILNSDV